MLFHSSFVGCLSLLISTTVEEVTPIILATYWLLEVFISSIWNTPSIAEFPSPCTRCHFPCGSQDSVRSWGSIFSRYSCNF
ncbi:hypothetical protein F5884DRAFT_760008 [Xylogone sp. PMI_703]|nr:hypothetical protein F5884DRAFT_760008 [Xylogone sp. PMI_703]